jgi:GntR family histidine utilization transcriptional repressor
MARRPLSSAGLSAGYGAACKAREFCNSPPAKWLLSQVPWSKARHVIRAVSADAATARILQIERGEACLNLIRQTWQNERLVTYVEITHPGDRFQFAGVFHPAEKRPSRRQP